MEGVCSTNVARYSHQIWPVGVHHRAESQGVLQCSAVLLNTNPIGVDHCFAPVNQQCFLLIDFFEKTENKFSMLDLQACCRTVGRDRQRRWNGLETFCAPYEGPRLLRRCHMIVVDVNGRYTVRFV